MPNRTTILQVCHVVKDLDAAVSRWVESFGAGPFYVGDFKLENCNYRGRAVRSHITVAIGYLGSTNIELAQTHIEGPCLFDEVLRSRGEGLHHYWVGCKDMDQAIADYEAAGHPLVFSADLPQIGRSAYVDTMATSGAFTEIQVFSDCVWSVLEEMHTAHVNWDGKDPIRDYPPLTPDGTPFRGHAEP